VYGESFKGVEHLADIMKEATEILDNAFRRAGA
jgi:phosphoglucomutase